MEALNRRNFLRSASIVGTTLAIGVPRVARAADFQYKLGTDAPNGHPVNIRLQEAADAIRKKSNGSVDIQLFPNNQLGGSTDMLSQVRAGGIEFLSIPTSILSVIVPVAAICGIGFAFKNYDAVWQAMDGDLGAYIRAETLKVRLVAMEKILDNGFRQISTSSRSINSPAELNGLKIRVPPSPMWTSLFRALKAAPTSINFAELYSALQTKIVDGQENSLPIINAGKLYEVQKYCSMTNHMWDGYWVVANQAAFMAMPKDLREIVAQSFETAALAQRADIFSLSNSLRPSLEQSGMVFNQPATAPFRAALSTSGFYAEWKQTFGADPWALLEKYSGTLV
ncbi:MAG TPA: TRAP transporter substrate-binding protein [Stellaceae bacterium]|nr:TRAP transporter substrate-binding protein [Stellaceae bacterium]